MASLNRIVILGKVQTDLDTKFTVDGRPIAKFGLPVNNGFNQAPGTIEVVCFSKLAEMCGQFVKKDLDVLVEGKIQIRTFDDQNGNRNWVTEIVATNVESLDNAKVEKQPVAQAVQDANGFEEVEELPEDDLPF